MWMQKGVFKRPFANFKSIANFALYNCETCKIPIATANFKVRKHISQIESQWHLIRNNIANYVRTYGIYKAIIMANYLLSTSNQAHSFTVPRSLVAKQQYHPSSDGRTLEIAK